MLSVALCLPSLVYLCLVLPSFTLTRPVLPCAALFCPVLSASALRYGRSLLAQSRLLVPCVD